MWHTILVIFFTLLLLGATLVIISDVGDSGRKLAWLLVITFLPVVGLLLYIIFGFNWRNESIFRLSHKNTIDLFRESSDDALGNLLFGKALSAQVREEYAPLVRLLSREVNPSVSKADSVEIIIKGKRKYDLLMEDLANAKESIHMEYFHFGIDRGSKAIRDMLMKKASEGVTVRFLNENIANLPIHPSYYNSMRKAGVQVRKFTNTRGILTLIAMLNYRNHRKIVVIDGKIGYTGGMNINDNYFLRWRDTHLRLTGDAVASLQYIFLDSWLSSKGTLDTPLKDHFPMLKGLSAPPPSTEGDLPLQRDKLVQIVPDEPDVSWPVIQMSYEWVLLRAKKYVYMQTPYFIPPEPVLDAIKTAAMGGTEVCLMISKKADNFIVGLINESYYEECLKAGVRIFLREGAFSHAKTFVSDDYLSCIGTANMDFRSFQLAYEVNSYIYDTETAKVNRDLFLRETAQCVELSYRSWSQRPLWRKLLQHLFRLFAPLA